jgi:hypothetical protein
MKDHMYYSKNAYYKQNSTSLTFQNILALVAHKTGCNPIRSGRGYVACCPAHDDKHSSLSITEGDDGKTLMCCHAGCSIKDICASLNIEVKDLFLNKSKRDYRV